MDQAMPQAMREGRHEQVRQEFADFKNQGKEKYNSKRLGRKCTCYSTWRFAWWCSVMKSLMRDEVMDNDFPTRMAGNKGVVPAYVNGLQGWLNVLKNIQPNTYDGWYELHSVPESVLKLSAQIKAQILRERSTQKEAKGLAAMKKSTAKTKTTLLDAESLSNHFEKKGRTRYG